MNFQILEKAFIPLLLATIFIVAFNYQFPHTYAYIIEHFKDVKLSVLYSHLFIYTFLILTLFIFFLTFINNFILKSNFFIGISILMLLLFYALSHKIIYDILIYFIQYPFSSNAIMGMILFVVSSFAFALYSLLLAFMKRRIPFSHASFFFLFATLYSAFFIDKYCYPISEIMKHI